MPSAREGLPGPLRAAAASAALLLAASAASAGGTGVFPEDASATGAGVDELFWLATWSGAVAFAIVVAILVYCVIAFRDRPGHRALYAPGDGRRARVATGVFAAVVFVALDVNLAVKDHEVFEAMYGEMPSEDEALVVECLARQFEWHFRYAGRDGEFGTGDDYRTINHLHVPADRPTLVRLKSIDVVHSFFLPHFRTKQDAVPGMETLLAIRPARTGEFEIACAELCGMGHYRMRGFLHVEDGPGWEAFEREQLDEIAEYGPSTTAEEYWRQWSLRGGEGR